MRIGNINQSTNFGRIIKIHTSAPYLTKKEEEQATKELVNVLNSKKSNVYSSHDAIVDIKPYFKTILGDYNGKDGILTQKYYDNDYLISGEEAKQISKIREAVDADLVSSKKAQKRIDEIFRENVEDGAEDECGIVKPSSVIKIEYTKPDLKADIIRYASIKEIDNEYVSDYHVGYVKPIPNVDTEE